MRTFPIQATALLFSLSACVPSPSANPPATPRYVVRVTSGEVRGLGVDWAIFPNEGWPLEGRRDHTPFQTDLPQGRVAAMFRPTLPDASLNITIFLRQADGSLKQVSSSRALPLAVVVVDPKAAQPSILSSAEPMDLGVR